MKPPRIYARSGYFWIRYFVPGQKNEVRRTTGIDLDIPPPESSKDRDWWKASRHKIKLQKLLADAAFDREAMARGVDVSTGRDTPDLDELLEEFNAANAIERDRERSPATLKHRVVALDFFKRHLKGKPWYSITRQWVLDLRKQAKQELAPASLRGYFVVLKMIYTYAVREGYIATNPFQGITVAVPKSAPARNEIADEKRLFTFLYHKLRPLFFQVMFQRLTGLRVSDVCMLKTSSINRKTWDLTYLNIKPGRWETVPLSAAAIELVRMMPPALSEWLFEYRHIRTVIRYIQKASAYAEVPPIKTHSLKRSYLQEIAKKKPDARTFDALAHHVPSVNKVAVEEYSGSDRELMLEALEAAQGHWVEFLKHLPQTKWDDRQYYFANENTKRTGP